MIYDKHSTRLILFLIFFLGVIPVISAASVRISGRVTDVGTGEALAGLLKPLRSETIISR